MEKNPNQYITVEYELMIKNSNGEQEMIEKATAEHPFQFISGFGTTLDFFEKQTVGLSKGEKFDFVIPVDEAYGEYHEEYVTEVEKKIFEINGKFDTERIYPGNVVPLMNAEGERFNATVVEIKANSVVLDMNHPLAGQDLHFVGSIVDNREATNEEIQELLKAISGEGGCCGGGCGGNCNGGCEGGCGDKEEKDGCCGKCK